MLTARLQCATGKSMLGVTFRRRDVLAHWDHRFRGSRCMRRAPSCLTARAANCWRSVRHRARPCQALKASRLAACRSTTCRAAATAPAHLHERMPDDQHALTQVMQQSALEHVATRPTWHLSPRRSTSGGPLGPCPQLRINHYAVLVDNTMTPSPAQLLLGPLAPRRLARQVVSGGDHVLLERADDSVGRRPRVGELRGVLRCHLGHRPRDKALR